MSIDNQAMLLPPSRYRRGPRENLDDEVYVRKSVELVSSIAELVEGQGAKGSSGESALSGSSILDIGCGPLRLISGLRAMHIEYRRYAGVDVDAEVIDWAQEQLADTRHQFHCLDMENARYNPEGARVSSIRLPFEDSSFDLVVLRSVFTHMEMEDIEVYLREIARTLHPDGNVYLSIYVCEEDEFRSRDVLEFNANPDKGPLHMQLVSRQWFEQKLVENGLKVNGFYSNIMHQPTYLIRRAE